MGSRRFSAPADRGLGVVLIAGSAVAYSTAGFFTRLIHVDLWTLIFWRGLFSTAFLLAVAHVQLGRQALRPVGELDRWGWVAAGFSTAAMFCYLAALRATSVADVAIIYGTAPFVTAAVALIVIGERTTPATLWSSAVALIGVALMFAGSSISRHLSGDLLAVAMTVLMALMIIATRRFGERDIAADRRDLVAGVKHRRCATPAPRHTQPAAVRRAGAVRHHPAWARAAAAHRRRQTALWRARGADRRPGRATGPHLGVDRVRRDPKSRHDRRRAHGDRRGHAQHAAIELQTARQSRPADDAV